MSMVLNKLGFLLNKNFAIALSLTALGLFYTILILKEYQQAAQTNSKLLSLVQNLKNSSQDESNSRHLAFSEGVEVVQTTENSYDIKELLETRDSAKEINGTFKKLSIDDSFGTNFLNGSDTKKYICEPDLVKFDGKQVCKPVCPRGFFYLPGMAECHRWLTCNDIRREVMLGPRIANGNVKRLYMGRWKDFDLVVNRGNKKLMKSYFLPGLKNIIALQPSPYVIQYIGHCRNFLLTELHPLGDARYIDEVLLEQYPHLDSIKLRFRLCLDYAAILSYLADPFLHNGGAYIMCDTSGINKLVSQYLVTSSFRIILNDIDSLPFIDYSSGQNRTRCGKKPKVGLFSAPETRWPRGMAYSKDHKIYYDEKVDIWKVPDVCNYLLGDINGSRALKIHLSEEIHLKCKSINPKKRPTAAEILSVYKNIYNSL